MHLWWVIRPGKKTEKLDVWRSGKRRWTSVSLVCGNACMWLNANSGTRILCIELMRSGSVDGKHNLTEDESVHLVVLIMINDMSNGVVYIRSRNKK